jgi:hypothetical protein
MNPRSDLSKMGEKETKKYSLESCGAVAETLDMDLAMNWFMLICSQLTILTS